MATVTETGPAITVRPRRAETENAPQGLHEGLLEQTLEARNLEEASRRAADVLSRRFAGTRFAVGLRRRGRGPCRLVALSGAPEFDAQGPLTMALEAALNEAILRDAPSHLSSPGSGPLPATLAQDKLARAAGAAASLSLPLHDSHQCAVGAMIVLGEPAVDLRSVHTQLEPSLALLTDALAIFLQLEGYALIRHLRRLEQLWSRRRAQLVAVVVMLCTAALLIPVPYRLRANCRLEPVVRRFVTAPFEGTLERCYVELGQVVQEGDLLARMDGREFRWQEASVTADRQQAVKRRDAAQATHRFADQQIAELEIERLELELQLLQHRKNHLEMRSPVTGVVVSGDLERAEGATLTVGQTLFEIAPLDRMLVEIDVPDDDVALVECGQGAQIHLDAYPRETWHTDVELIEPRSALRDHQNVFLIEAELENASQRLRPGMKGRASIKIDHRCLAWVLFHKPWEFLVHRLTW